MNKALMFFLMSACGWSMTINDPLPVQVIKEADLVSNARILEDKLSSSDYTAFIEAVTYISAYLASNPDMFPGQGGRDHVVGLFYHSTSPRFVIIHGNLMRISVLDKTVSKLEERRACLESDGLKLNASDLELLKQAKILRADSELKVKAYIGKE
jgi:hypothetical protein